MDPLGLLLDLSIFEKGKLKSLPMIVDFPILLCSSVNICFIYFKDRLLGTYKV